MLRGDGPSRLFRRLVATEFHGAAIQEMLNLIVK
jgi:hypothetical protein